MTVAVSIKVNDGVVLASDSASTLLRREQSGRPRAQNVYNHANKLFRLVKGVPVGAVTWGAGSIGPASISTLMKDFRRYLVDGDPNWDGMRYDDYTVLDLANRLRAFVYEDRYRIAFDKWPSKPVLGFMVAGYSSAGAMAEEYEIVIHTDGNCPPPRLLRPVEDAGGVSWNGEPEAIHRLLMGFGSELPKVLREKVGMPQDQIAKATEALRGELMMPLVHSAMPIQDAIDLAEFLVDLTIKVSRFAPGAPTVGGPIDIAAITRHEGFKWVRRKHYYSREINPADDDVFDE